MSGFDFNTLLRYAKKAFTFYKKFKSQQNQNQGQGGQQQQHHQQQQQPQQGGAWNNQQQSPYPPSHGQQQQQHGAWQQSQPQQEHHSGPYGAHDGPATNQDMANAQNSYYVDLRNKAIHEGDLMGRAFSASKQAYASGDGGRAHDLSVEGKEHQRLKEQYNDQAAQWIFNENNKVQPRGTIDLHGLYVQESIDFTERAIQNARQEGLPELRVIVGKGNHSAAHVAKIKPAITSLMQKENLTAHLDQHNSGVLVVLLQGQGTGKSSREVIGDLERDPNNDCVVM
ncbi:hypothetical protein MVLG_05204 [Microbotryum lychnidis-dioicae p1A1 Lamole]|uniref:Smr domain-containing protein n=1 Tax=Microbotryum lychnidis-dioicae (strain p1A1 Lamole / MvSl-1064) TaxID=683840 RepID=U5HDJ1_USTV1|nr:hypothetical protein MVLG_05204 [Microbotryum lychnidis-dioicae p1A1 Lamole]|eukprot:KDE04323.1 hypothetical protein MVLG_05204 [Microbotryum lychnidis-dioicae p1A1 Lamole]